MSASTGVTVWLVRHGETEWSKSGRHTGATDLTLTDDGRAQAERLRPALAPVTFARIVTSPRTRARATCLLAGCADRAGVPAEIEDDLAEWDYGDYEGLTSAQIQAKAPGWSLWTDGAPGGESPDEICARVDRVLARCRQLPGDLDVALFAHGHVLRVVALRWLGWPLTHGAQLGLDTASIGRLTTTNGRATLATWNERP